MGFGAWVPYNRGPDSPMGPQSSLSTAEDPNKRTRRLPSRVYRSRGTPIQPHWVPALLVLLLIGATMRLYRFTELPYGVWYDEADNGLWVREILSDPGFRPIYVPSTNLPAHFLYLVALSFRLFGDSMHAIRVQDGTFWTSGAGLGWWG